MAAAQSESCIVGVDVGGTFSDAVVVRGTEVAQAKAPSTPADQSRGALAAIERALAALALEPPAVARFVHGTTVGTNSVLEGKLATTALLATEGFEDLEELRRQNRPALYRLCEHPPQPIVPPALRIGVPERTGPDGVLRALDRAALRARLRAVDAEAVAVCLLWSFRHPQHELAVGELVRDFLPHAHVSLSCETARVVREYERCATTIVDAAVSPRLRTYLERLEQRARAHDLPAPEVMLSSGGVAPARVAAAHGSWTVLSGPAAGAVACARLAEREGFPDAVGLDMGGTSCDVSLARAGRPRVVLGGEVAGRPLALPMVEVHTVGAGGGSTAWRDAGGALRVGPESAGADPGPACYGRGGRAPTVTDANVVLGYLADRQRFGGELAIDAAAAYRAVAELARALEMPTEQCAEGIVDVACAEMAQAVRVLTVERGIDPRTLCLCAFGGAGPLHAARIAEELGIARIVVPAAAGVLSALGLATAERRRDAVESVLLRDHALDDRVLRRALAAVADRARSALGGEPGTLELACEVRYEGQSFEVPVETGLDATVADLRARFDHAHQERYGWSAPDSPIELVTVRAAAIAPAAAGVGAARLAAGTIRGERPVRWRGTTVVARWAQGAVAGEGPLVAELDGATLFVPPGWRARLGDAAVIVEREEHRT